MEKFERQSERRLRYTIKFADFAHVCAFLAVCVSEHDQNEQTIHWTAERRTVRRMANHRISPNRDIDP